MQDRKDIYHDWIVIGMIGRGLQETCPGMRDSIQANSRNWMALWTEYSHTAEGCIQSLLSPGAPAGSIW